MHAQNKNTWKSQTDELPGHAECEVTAEWSRGDVQQAPGYKSLKQGEGSGNTKWKVTGILHVVVENMCSYEWASRKDTNRDLGQNRDEKITARFFNIIFVLTKVRSKLKEGV